MNRNEYEGLVHQLVWVESLMDKATDRTHSRWNFANDPSYRTPLMWEPVVVYGPDGKSCYYESVEQYLETR